MKILIVKTSAIGDVIHTLPALDYLLSCYPHAHIDWVVEKGGHSLLAAHPKLHRVLKIETKSWRKGRRWKEMFTFFKELRNTSYDLLFDLQGNTKSAPITLFAKAKEKIGYDWHSVPEKLNLLATNKKVSIPKGLSIRERYLRLVKRRGSFLHLPRKFLFSLTASEQERLEALKFSSPCYMVAFGSNWKNKKLSEEVLQEFLATLSASFIFIWSNGEEKIVAERLQKAFPSGITLGNLSLPLWQAVMDRVDCVIAMDSAALHLCATTNTPSFSVFGPSNAQIYKPEGASHVAVQGSCPYGKTFEKRCPILRTCKTGACIHNITADELSRAFLQSNPK